MKVYIKKGNTNYKEKKLVSKLTEVIEKKLAEDPNFKFEPATNFEDLQTYYNRYCIEDVEFTEIKNDTAQPAEVMEEKTETNSQELVDKLNKNDTRELNDTADDQLIDPLNRQEPNIRDYVLKEEYPGQTRITEGQNPNQPKQEIFNEPVSFEEAFEMPGSEDGKGKKTKKDTSNSGNNSNDGKTSDNKQKSEPLNPSFNSMADNKKRKSTKKFAKYIVEVVCMLSEKGFVWYANNEINDAKLAEFELTGEIDLSILVTLENGQEATVKQFFQAQCFKAEALCKIDAEEKKDLAEALEEVLLEKGVAPTPMQELMMVGLKIFGGQAINLLTLKSQSSSVLNQLRAMNAPREEEQAYTPPPQPRTPEPQPAADKKEVLHEEVKQPVEQKTEVKHETLADLERELEASETTNSILDKPVETKE